MVVVEWLMVPGKPASRHECPKCVSSMLTIVRSVGSDTRWEVQVRVMLAGLLIGCCAAARAAADGSFGPTDLSADVRSDPGVGVAGPLVASAGRHLPLAGAGRPGRSRAWRRGSGSRNSARVHPCANDPRAYAVAARAVAGQPDGQWQVQAQIVHWRGETWRGGQLASAAFDAAVAALRACQVTAPQFSPSITTAEPNRMAAVISGPVVVHQYLLVDPRSSTISELVFSHNAGERAARGAVAGGARRAGAGRDGGAAVRAPTWARVGRVGTAGSAATSTEQRGATRGPGSGERDAQGGDSRPAGPGHRRRTGPARACRNLRCPAGQAI